MLCSRGDIALVLYPDSNLQTAKRRPVLVIQADDLGTGMKQTLVAMISSNMSRAGHPSRVPIHLSTPEGQQSGLQMDSVVMTDNIATILDARIERILGTWSDMPSVEVALCYS